MIITYKSITFAPQLSYGVMVALQFLVLSVVVRIRLGQRGNPLILVESADFFDYTNNRNYYLL